MLEVRLLISVLTKLILAYCLLRLLGSQQCLYGISYFPLRNHSEHGKIEFCGYRECFQGF